MENTEKISDIVPQEFSSEAKNVLTTNELIQDILSHTYEIESLSIKVLGLIAYEDPLVAELMRCTRKHIEAIQRDCCAQFSWVDK